MPTYSAAERLEAIRRAGFADPWTALAVSVSEFGEGRDVRSQGQSDERYPAGSQYGTGRERSFGPWQIHLPAHPDVTESCALDLDCSTAAAYRISKGGTDFGPWSVYKSGAYKKVLPDLLERLDPELLERIRLQLGTLAKSVGTGALSGEDAAKRLREAFPDVPKELLQAIAYRTGDAAAQNITNAPVLGGAVQAGVAAGEKAQELAKGVEGVGELIAFVTAPENLWRVAFAIVGGVMIVAGARLYLRPSSIPSAARMTA